MAATRLSLNRRLALTAFVALAAAALLLATGFDLGVLMLLPALVTLVVLLVWPEPGLELILRIANRRRRRSTTARFRAGRGRLTIARGGRLLSASLGGRAPPALRGCN